MIVPPALSAGDAVRVIAPSSPFQPALVWRGLGWLSERYEVRYERRIFERCGYLAGTDEARLAELTAALQEPGVAAVLCARGGYGVTRLLEHVDWSHFVASPRWIVGFSDITALHAGAWSHGVASLHASNVTAVGRGDRRTREGLLDYLEAPTRQRSWTGLDTIRAGCAEGPLVGGNLTLLQACAAAGSLHMPRGAILVLEDVTERPYRLDRALTSLLSGGFFRDVAGVILGEFLQCDPAPDGVTADAMLRERLLPLAVPIVAGAPVGHGRNNEPFVCGATVRLDAGAGSVRF